MATVLGRIPLNELRDRMNPIRPTTMKEGPVQAASVTSQAPAAAPTTKPAPRAVMSEGILADPPIPGALTWNPELERAKAIELTEKLVALARRRFTGKLTISIYRGSISREVQVSEIRKIILPRTQLFPCATQPTGATVETAVPEMKPTQDSEEQGDGEKEK